MTYNMNFITKDGKKMMYLISIGVKKDCEDYDAIWTELNRRMNAVSIPIVNVDWLLYSDDGKAYSVSKFLFYAQTFETGMGFISSVLKDHTIRSNLEFCEFLNGDAYKTDAKKYDTEDVLDSRQKFLKKYHFAPNFL